MIIFIKDYNLNKLISKLPLLDKYIKETNLIYEIYSEDGIYQIDSNNIYKLCIDDKPIEYYNNYYNSLSLICDNSSINKIKENQVPNNGIENYIKNIYYSLNSTSKIKLVIQIDNNLFNQNNDNNIINVYFEINIKDEDIDLNNYFIKNELNVFLSILN
jgi:hypothetical protein